MFHHDHHVHHVRKKKEGDAQTCRVGCPHEPDSLSHYNECLGLYDIFIFFSGQATILPRRNHFLHDLVTHVFFRSLQHGIEVMGFFDAFVYSIVVSTVEASRIPGTLVIA